jgi:tRNA A-37 threonylcarbamoyl transferase component Bud32
VAAERLIIAQHQSILHKLDLASFEGVRRYTGPSFDDHSDLRDIHRIQTTDEHGRPLVFFMKRIHRTFRKDALRSLLAHGRVWSSARQEWENALLLEQAGIPVAPLVAYGEQLAMLRERFSFIITEEAPGRCLDDFVRTCRDMPLRRRVFDDLARLVQRMHNAGLAAPDLFLRHVFVDTAGEAPRFHLIDMNRLDIGRISPKQRARDIAGLHVTAPLGTVSITERLRFLQTYAGSINRKLFHLIARRARHQLRKPRFQFFYGDRPTPQVLHMGERVQ